MNSHIDKRILAVMDWLAQERLNNDACGFTEEYYSGLINVLSREFSISREDLTSYFNEEYSSIEEEWASETDVNN